MCTSFSIQTKEGHNFFGRNLDLAYNVNESPTFLPRNYELEDKISGDMVRAKRTMIGMETVIGDHPSMFEAMNEEGLVCAGLHFEGFAHFEEKPVAGKTNVTPYDFIYRMVSVFNNPVE
jgi:choloylglycine hydrolase